MQELQAEPALDAVQQISDLRKQLVKKDRRQEDKIKEIERQCIYRRECEHRINFEPNRIPRTI